MPRMSAAEKQKSHDRILDAAARLFRERGIEAASIADVMHAAGLTHGGFYKHFPSKQALVAEAFRHAAGELLSGAGAGADAGGAARAGAQARFIARYLSPDHVADAGQGCPVAALGADAVRHGGAVQAEASRAFERMAAFLAPDGPDGEDRGLALMALLAGTVTLARLADTPELAARVIAAGRRAAGILGKEAGEDSVETAV